MTDTTAACWGAPSSFDGRIFPRRDQRRFVRIVGGACVVGLGTVAIACLSVVAVTAAAWIMATMHSAKPHLDVRVPAGPTLFAVADRYPALAEGADSSGSSPVPIKPLETAQLSFEARWGGTMAPTATPARTVPLVAYHSLPHDNSVPLPRAHPSNGTQDEAKPELARTPAGDETPRVAAAAVPPPPESAAQKSAAPKQAHNKSIALPGADSRTAVYDISARTVYLPSGERLEAHSGLGDKLDNPRYVHVKMRGPTPPNVYDLTLREQLFHGVRAIRLNPVDGGKMFGRDGMLAHTYMLGPNGQSNGCVSFKDYSKFLRAYLNGDVNRLVVVSRLGDTPLSVARAGRGADSRYASADAPASASAFTW